MSKMTQKEMLLEGFLDAVRASARTLSKGAVKAVGGTVGATLGATKNIARDLVKADVNANPFSSIASGAVQGAKTGSDLASKGVTAITGKEEAALRQVLETEYRDVFQPISLKIGRGKPDPTNMNIIIIPFTGRKLGDPTIIGSSTVPNQPTSKVAKLLQTPGIAGTINTLFGTQFVQGETGTPGNRFMSPLTQFITNLEKSKQGIFQGYVKKTGSKERPYTITVRDMEGQIIQPSTTEKQIQPKLDVLLQKIPQFKPTNSTVKQWSVALLRAFNKGNNKTYRDIIDAAVPAAVGNDTYVLTPNDIVALRKSLKDDHMLISEKNTQAELLLQLKNLNDSYNKTYEL